MNANRAHLYPSLAGLAQAPDEAVVLEPSVYYPRSNPEPTGPMFSVAKDYEPALRQGIGIVADHLDFDPEMTAAYTEETATFFREMGYSPHEANGLHDLLVQGMKVRANPEKSREWEAQVVRGGRYDFGRPALEKRVALVNGHLTRRPILPDLLTDTGMVSNSKLVHALLSLAHALPKG